MTERLESKPPSRRGRRDVGVRSRFSVAAMIYRREMVDQLRDRRTLFTVAVLPLMLYPLVGMLLLQMTQFSQTRPSSVVVVGQEHLTENVVHAAPELTTGRGTQAVWGDAAGVASPADWRLVSHRWDEVHAAPDPLATATRWVRGGAYDAAVVIPPVESDGRPDVRLLFNTTSEQSGTARARLEGILANWRTTWVDRRMTARGLDPAMLRPHTITALDTAPRGIADAANWSKLLPFVMLVWALTGAFYPAIDLVAGEKERGTLETLLTSPATRREVVWGKLAAVTTFSIATAVMNAASMLVTGSFVLGRVVSGATPGMAAPPVGPMLWLLVALLPLSALFSALALGVAAMARSSKEGQYYLMPLMMVALPLVMLPMLPGMSLSIGTAIIPVTGLFLAVRELIEADYFEAMMYLPIVALVTAACLHAATEWARRQFESETVLFGGGDGWELRRWVSHLWRDRQIAATPVQAYACGVIVLVAMFFGKLSITSMPTDLASLSQIVVIPQVALIATPAAIMALCLTTRPAAALRMRRVDPRTLMTCVALAVAIHPTHVALSSLIQTLYPLSDAAKDAMSPLVAQIEAAPWWGMVILMAAVPAVCEELAFRGFIFGGLIRGRNPWRAILVSAFLFGITHGILQQSLAAMIIGVLLGWVAWRTGSVWTTMAMHLVINALGVCLSRIAAGGPGLVGEVVRMTGDSAEYHPVYWLVATVLAGMLIHRLHRTSTAEGDDASDRIDVAASLSDPGHRLASVPT